MVDKVIVGSVSFLLILSIVCFYPLLVTQPNYNAYVESKLQNKGITVRSDVIIDSPSMIVRVPTLNEFINVAKGQSSAGPVLPDVYFYNNFKKYADVQYGFYVFNLDRSVAYVYDTSIPPFTFSYPQG